MNEEELRELARRAEALYERLWRQDLERDHRDMFVAIEPDTERYFLGSTMNEASTQAQAACPGRMTHIMRVGHAAAIYINKTRRYTLEELLEQVTPENRHDEIDFGPPVGNEIW